MSILAVGSVAYDGIETPKGKVDRVLGGSATYITLASSYLTEPVRLVGTVGNDFADEDISFLKSRNVDLEGFKVDQNEKTFFWRGRYHDDFQGRDTLETQLNVIEKFDTTVPESYRDTDIVCLGNIDPTLQLEVLEQVNNPKLTVCDTMNLWIENTREQLDKLIGKVDALIINDEEAQQLTGEVNLVAAANKIRGMGPSIVIIKKGEHGALMFTDSGIFNAPAVPLSDISDPTGAGDSFLGGFSGWLSRTQDFSDENLRRAVIYGTAMASFCVEDFGPYRFKNLSQKDIIERYESLQKMNRIPDAE